MREQRRAPEPVPPRISLPVQGSATLQAVLTGKASIDGQAVVAAEVGKRRAPLSDLFVAEGSLLLELAPHAVWVRIGNVSFRTDPEQHLSIYDFINEVHTYSQLRAVSGGQP